MEGLGRSKHVPPSPRHVTSALTSTHHTSTSHSFKGLREGCGSVIGKSRSSDLPCLFLRGMYWKEGDVIRTCLREGIPVGERPKPTSLRRLGVFALYECPCSNAVLRSLARGFSTIFGCNRVLERETTHIYIYSPAAGRRLPLIRCDQWVLFLWTRAMHCPSRRCPTFRNTSERKEG